MASVCSVGILLNNVALQCGSPVGVREYPGDLRDWNARGYGVAIDLGYSIDNL